MVPPTGTYEFDFSDIPGRSAYGVMITDVNARNLPQMSPDGEVWITLTVYHRRQDPSNREERALVRVVDGERAFISLVDSTYDRKDELPNVVQATIKELREYACEITVPAAQDPRAR